MYPSVDGLLEKVGSRYKLAALATKRAQKLDEFYRLKEEADLAGKPVSLDDSQIEIAPTLSRFKSYKSVGKALEEIEAGNIIIDQDEIDTTQN
jgi:DNA-directed RNA polymerase subunit omega